MSVRKLVIAGGVMSALFVGVVPAFAGQGGGGGSTSSTCRKNCPSPSPSASASPSPSASASPSPSASASPAPTVSPSASPSPSPSTAPVTTTSGADIALADPAAVNGLQLVGRGRTAEWGALTAVVYWEESTNRRGVFFRDATTGSTSYVTLPSDTRNGWTSVSYTLTSARDLWVFGGAGPLVLRHYALSGTPVPSSAALLSSEILGDADSRPGDLLRLTSGALVASWGQQGAIGPQGLWLAYRPSTGSGQLVGPLQFMPSKSTNQSLAQHPADGSLWLFNDPDAWGSLGAARLVEGAAGLTVDWTDAYWIDGQKYGANRPDPENPDVTAVADPARGQIVLAYEGSTRKAFQTSPTVLIGSQPIIARVPAIGAPSFTTLPVYVERVSDLSLSLAAGSTWLAFHPVDEATMTFDRLQVAALSTAGWSAPRTLGTLRDGGAWVTASATRAEFAAGMNDGAIHFLQPGS